MFRIREKLGLVFRVRHLQVFLLFLCSAISYFLRISVTLAVVAMTNKDTSNPDFEEFNWNVQEQSYILSSFFWGYLFTQLPGGYIAQKYGAKFILLISVLVPSLLNLIIPISIKYGGWEVFCIIRVFQGIFQGCVFPAFNAYLSKWAPVEERNRLGVIAFSGIEVGTILAFIASGFIAASNLGWPGILYVAGGIGLLWSIIWYLLCANNPAESKSISSTELEYIESSLNQNVAINNNDMRTPWLQILTSAPFLSLLCVRICFTWGFTTLLIQLPLYMHNILKMDIRNNAVYSAIPYVAMLIVAYLIMFIAVYLSKKQLLSLTIIRKIANSIATWIPGIGLIVIGFFGSIENSALVVVVLTIVIGAQGCATLGSFLNHIDLSPNHVGVLVGITNTFASIVSLLTPICFGLIVTDMENRYQWQIIFNIAATLMILGNLVYIIFGKMDAQSWNSETRDIKLKNYNIENVERPHVVIK